MAPVTPVIPDHELVRRIGGGSYGDVWLARTAVGTWRAVKVVFRDRFTDARPYEREFSGMLKFEPLSRGNEAFVDILQIGRNDADGYFYYVMELADDASVGDGSSQMADGEKASCDAKNSELRSPNSHLLAPATYVPKTLSKVLLQRGRLPVTECLELGLTLNLGLAQLHRAGLIHRDIKPSNIIFVGGVPKLADIGLVVEVAEARSFVGTEGFIPPEGPNSPQADLFSLGKVLYEAGMGKDRKDFPEPLTQIAEVPDSPQLLEFNAILLKACAASRTERYQSAEEMNADLALLQSGGSVRQQRKLAGQLRFVQRAGALVTALAAVIALGWWWQARQTARVRELAEENLNLAKLVNTSAALAHRSGVRAREAPGAAGTDFDRQALQTEQLRLEQALQACTRALALIGPREKALGLELTLHRQRGSLLRALGRMDEAATENLALFGIAPRDPALPAAAIDLSAHYTTTLAWDASRGKLGSDLRELPVGPQVLAGTVFDVRALVNLTQYPEWGYWPTRVDGIRIGRKLTRLHFLHAAGGWDASIQKGDRIGRYRLHYADGRTVDLPLRYHVDTADWWEHSGRPRELPEATVVWRGFTMRGRPEGPQPIRLFRRTWENPHPGIEVTELDIVAEHALIVPMLIALTAE
jgi:hypothetical protein